MSHSEGKKKEEKGGGEKKKIKRKKKKEKKSREAHGNEIYHLCMLPLRTHGKNGVQ